MGNGVGRLRMAKGLFILGLTLVCAGAGLRINAYGEQKRPCAEEVEKFCKGVPPGEGRVAECLNKREKELSAECSEKVAEVRKKLEEAHEACADDIKRFCSDIEPGTGRLAKCLREHETELSPLCRPKVSSRNKMLH